VPPHLADHGQLRAVNLVASVPADLGHHDPLGLVLVILAPGLVLALIR